MKRKALRINTKLLIDTLSVQTYSNNETRMVEYLSDKLGEIEKEMDLTLQKDTYGNIYITKGKADTYPCVVSHMDTVAPIVDRYSVHRDGDILFAFNRDTKKQTDIGGDDKVGVFVCLQALKDFDNIKVVFYSNEEIGHLGSRYSIKNHKDFYTDVNFVLQCDRKNDNDFIYHSGGHRICSEEFLSSCKPYTDALGFKPAIGISTDVDTLVAGGIGVSAVNISSGYYNPHTNNSSVSVRDVARTYTLVFDILTNLGDQKFEYTYEPVVYKGGTYSSSAEAKQHENKFLSVKPQGTNFTLWIPDYDYTHMYANKLCKHCNTGMLLNISTGEMSCFKCNAIATDLDDHRGHTIWGRISTPKRTLDQLVYSSLYNAFLLFEDAVWSTNYKSYVPKKANIF